MKKKSGASFVAWLEGIRRALISTGLFKSDVVPCPESWRVHYDDNLPPNKAVELQVEGSSVPFGFMNFGVNIL